MYDFEEGFVHPIQQEIYNLNRSERAKLRRHDGLYTKDYQRARAQYDAQIRNWYISYHHNLFYVSNNDKEAIVYLEHGYWNGIANCSCIDFSANQCGTCAHIEAVRYLNPRTYSKIRPLRYIDDSFNIVQTNQSSKDIFELPSVSTFRFVESDKKIQPHELDYTDEQYDCFKDYGISLRPFQLTAIKGMIYNKHTCLALRVGTGKTFCALACMKILDLKRHIIITPSNLKYQWLTEINRFCLGEAIVVDKGELPRV